jgi:hypothetical protein
VNLPGQAAQALYLDIGWALVLAALVLRLLGPAGRRADATLAVCAAAAIGVSLPAPWSASFWLGMAFQYPSLLLVVLAALSLMRRPGRDAGAGVAPLLAPWPAASLLALALALYAGAFALVPYDLYGLGYARLAGATIATVLVLSWAALDRRRAAWSCLAVAVAAALHAATRLPSGNAWDALLDPFLAACAAFVVLRALRDRLRGASPVPRTKPMHVRS